MDTLAELFHKLQKLLQELWSSNGNPASKILLTRLKFYAILTRLHKPIGIFLLLWPTLWSLWIAAEGIPPTSVLIVFIAGVVLMRSAGCILNDIADRNLDGHVERTRMRPIVTGDVSPLEALGVAIAIIVCAFLLVLQMNDLTVYLAFGAVFFAAIYPFMKRFTYLPQFFLGIAFSWAIPMGFAAVTETVTPVAWLIFIANILWTVSYDTMYAMVDRDDDLKAGIKSTAILFADADRVIIGIIQSLFLIVILVVAEKLNLNAVFYGAIGVAGLFCLYQQYLIKDRKREMCMRAFLNNNWLGAAIFVGLVLNYSEFALQ